MSSSIEKYIPLVQVVYPSKPALQPIVAQPKQVTIAPIVTTTAEKIIANGVWTIKNHKTGDHRTFKIKTLPKNTKTNKVSRLVLLLVGSNNEENYKPFAFVSERGNQIFVFNKLRADKDAVKKSDYEIFARLLEDKFVHQVKFPNTELIGSATCLRCNRLLTTPESVERNYGPECWEKIGG